MQLLPRSSSFPSFVSSFFSSNLYLFLFQSDLLSRSGVVPKDMRGLLGIKPAFGKGARFEQFKHAWNLRLPNKTVTVNSLFIVFRSSRRLRVVSNFGDDAQWAGEIDTRAREISRRLHAWGAPKL